MKVKEAIEKTELELAIEYLNQIKHDQFVEFGYINQAVPIIISLLQRGGKQEKIIKRLLKKYHEIRSADSGRNERDYKDMMTSLLDDTVCDLE